MRSDMTEMEEDILARIMMFAGNEYYRYCLEYWAERFWAEQLPTETETNMETF